MVEFRVEYGDLMVSYRPINSGSDFECDQYSIATNQWILVDELFGSFVGLPRWVDTPYGNCPIFVLQVDDRCAWDSKFHEHVYEIIEKRKYADCEIKYKFEEYVGVDISLSLESDEKLEKQLAEELEDELNSIDIESDLMKYDEETWGVIGPQEWEKEWCEWFGKWFIEEFTDDNFEGWIEYYNHYLFGMDTKTFQNCLDKYVQSNYPNGIQFRECNSLAFKNAILQYLKEFIQEQIKKFDVKVKYKFDCWNVDADCCDKHWLIGGLDISPVFDDDFDEENYEDFLLACNNEIKKLDAWGCKCNEGAQVSWDFDEYNPLFEKFLVVE